jgi:hypothetical protein
MGLCSSNFMNRRVHLHEGGTESLVARMKELKSNGVDIESTVVSIDPSQRQQGQWRSQRTHHSLPRAVVNNRELTEL